VKKTNLDYIQQLSLMDKKDLLGKTLKIAEENGELSSKVLPFMNSHGTKHRFVDKESLLEEVADIILSARSVAYDLGFSHDDIEDMLMLKASKWANLQQAESELKDKVPYEIHVTIKEADQQKFLDSCKLLSVKPIILALQSEDRVIKDVMTSSVFMGNNRTVYDEMKRISDGLSSVGFEVLREKIETIPLHPAAPNRKFKNDFMPKDCYFECHLAIKMFEKNDGQKDLLSILCEKLNCHLSKNFFKKKEDGSYTIMATYRKYDGYSEDFIKEVTDIKSKFESSGFHVDKLITEFSIYDTKVSHDLEWLMKN
jgi:hypothetical protein